MVQVRDYFMQGATVYLLAPEWNGALCRRSIPSLAVIDNTEFEGLSIFFTVCKLLDDSFFMRITIFLVFSVIISCVQNKLPTVWGRWPELRGSFATQKFGFIQTINFMKTNPKITLCNNEEDQLFCVLPGSNTLTALHFYLIPWKVV